MCSTCGCGEGEVHIENSQRLPTEDDDLQRGSHHHGHNDHRHDEPGYHTHSHSSGSPQGAVIVHHHYHNYGDVHHHYAGFQTTDVRETASSHGEMRTFTPGAGPQDPQYGQGAFKSNASGLSRQRLVQIEQDVLSKNNKLANDNRAYFAERHILAINLLSSPGSGKTTLLVETLRRLSERIACMVIEGDQQTSNDAVRIRATGVRAIQVNTGKGCHLDAQMVRDAAVLQQPANGSVVFIENVGNLVCPAGFDLGEKHKVVILSVTEGEDKPLKYPFMFSAASLVIINKIDLLPYVNVDLAAYITSIRAINPDVQIIELSADSGIGMDKWLSWLEAELCV
ncbi:hydrogenase nickel incorporation protein HypB [Sodalis sp. dw_96]|uniref:hydrogenase nickel incorporation protein HypB n=1 Tax=Sodalis sp. dw_96 TaxID=2719794 RepID=UPI001BD2DF66|nr:hydrogenase nickel incorporation protein HypB [Sodalis sp. dw_96]